MGDDVRDSQGDELRQFYRDLEEHEESYGVDRWQSVHADHDGGHGGHHEVDAKECEDVSPSRGFIEPVWGF